MKDIIAILGLGYVGLPLGVEFGKIRPVIGFDHDTNRINELRSGKDDTLEVTEADLKSAVYLSFTDRIEDVMGCNIFIVAVPTPVDSVNRPDLTMLMKASSDIGKVIKPGALIIYESTVYPGCTEEICVPILEKVSGLKFNNEFFCGYSPERINPGDKVNTLKKIKKITSGSTIEAALKVDSLYAAIIEAGTFLATSIKVAEAAKVIENTQRDLNIALVNELSVIFHRLDIDTMEVLNAAGSKWNFLPFRPGMVGGHCIGIDPYYLTHKAEEVGYHPQVILAGRRINDEMATFVATNTIQLMIKNGIDVSSSRIGIFGITFKENCPDIRNSKVINLFNELKNWGAEVMVTDSWANPAEVFRQYKIDLKPIDEMKELDSLIIAVSHNDYRNLDLEFLKQICRSKFPVLVDVKAIYPKDKVISNGFTNFRL